MLAAAVLFAAACGDDDDTSEGDGDGGAAAADTLASDSEYCDAAVDWAIHEMTPFDDTDPAAFRAYWTEYTAFVDEAVSTAPEEIAADWQDKVEWETGLTAILEKYDFDAAVMQAQGTPEEAAAFEAPPEAAAAQDRILSYESAVCGAQQPPPADVSYAGEEAGTYCDLVGALQQQADEAISSGDPDQIEAFVGTHASSAPAIVDAAPEVIAEDVASVSDWQLHEQAEVLEAHGWDPAAVLRDGSVQDRYDFQLADEEIREQYARVAAYDEQVCGA